MDIGIRDTERKWAHKESPLDRTTKDHTRSEKAELFPPESTFESNKIVGSY